MSVYITGDIHGQIDRIYDFCLLGHNLSHKDIMIIAGDAGLNFWLNNTEKNKKAKLAKLPITIICIQGNHEKRPEVGLLNYKQIHIDDSLLKGDYWIEPEYPNILFAINYLLFNKSIASLATFCSASFFEVPSAGPTVKSSRWTTTSKICW